MQPTSIISSDLGLVRAQVISLQEFTTARGKRIYGLFQTGDGLTLGIWAEADDDLVSQLCCGDWVDFSQMSSGRY